MLKTSKVTPALIVVVFLIQGAISLPVPIPQYTYYSDDFPNPFENFSNFPTQATYVDSSSEEYMDYDDFNTDENFAYAIVASGSSLSDYQAYKNGEPVSIDQLPDGFRNFNPFKFDPFFNDDGSSQMDAFGNDIFEDYPLDVPFSYFM
ncbi:unnamed protein product [Larinioides sclopetarius]|uniref:Uncharacterized protein n=2 Tax=Larinioides sclopetarius TaxID=280406 RepID=A0AAV2BT56_9ARAC